MAKAGGMKIFLPPKKKTWRGSSKGGRGRGNRRFHGGKGGAFPFSSFDGGEGSNPCTEALFALSRGCAKRRWPIWEFGGMQVDCSPYIWQLRSPVSDTGLGGGRGTEKFSVFFSPLNFYSAWFWFSIWLPSKSFCFDNRRTVTVSVRLIAGKSPYCGNDQVIGLRSKTYLCAKDWSNEFWFFKALFVLFE